MLNIFCIVYICRDFNSRIGDMLDFIEGVDVITDRNVIDFGINKYVCSDTFY